MIGTSVKWTGFYMIGTSVMKELSFTKSILVVNMMNLFFRVYQLLKTQIYVSNLVIE